MTPSVVFGWIGVIDRAAWVAQSKAGAEGSWAMLSMLCARFWLCCLVLLCEFIVCLPLGHHQWVMWYTPIIMVFCW